MTDTRSGGTPAAAPAVDWDGIATAALQQKHAVDPRYFSPEFVLAMVDAHRELEAALGALSGVAPEPSEAGWPFAGLAFPNWSTGELVLRRLLWLRHHDTTVGLYGDDGEMQCGRCLIDFRRMSAAQIEQRFTALGIATLGAAGRGSAGPKRFFYRCTCGGEHEMGTAPPCGGGYLGEVPQ